jgi:hypothetical protein
MEADHFAAGLLMPQKLFIPALRRAGEGLAAIESLASLCQTSLIATAIRYTQCSRDPVAIIVSTGHTIDYCFMSNALRDVEGIDWIRKREALPRNTPTFEFNKDSEKVRQRARVTAASNLRDWFGGHLNIEIKEDVMGLGNYGKTLTVLYEIDIPDKEDEELEGKLIESWTPHFHH